MNRRHSVFIQTKYKKKMEKVTKKSLKVMIVGLTVLILFSSMAFAETITKTWQTGEYWYSGKFVAEYVPVSVKPFYQTQTQHTKGYTTTIGVSYSTSVTDTASATVTAGYNGFFVKCEAEVGLAKSVTSTIAVTQTFTIGSDKPTGLYRVETVFPRKTTKNTVHKLVDIRSPELVYTKTIQHMPMKNDSYKRLVKYGNVG